MPTIFTVIFCELTVKVFLSAPDVVSDGVCQPSPFVDVVLSVRLLSLLDEKLDVGCHPFCVIPGFDCFYWFACVLDIIDGIVEHVELAL